MFRVASLFTSGRLPKAGASLAYLVLLAATSLQAQELVRSAAEPLPIKTFSRSPEAFFRLGPIDGDVTATVGVDYTDNANLSSSGKVGKFSLFEGLNLDLTWVPSHLNQLEIVFGGQLTEDFFSNGRNVVNAGITPGSMIQYKFSLEDYRIRIYDQISYVQDPTLDPTVTNVAYLRRFTNTIGAEVSKDFNLFTFSVSGDYTYSNDNGSNVQGGTTLTGTRDSYRVGSALTFHYSPEILYGLEASATRSTGTGDEGNAGNVNSLSFGPFIRGTLSKETEFDLGAGPNLFDTKPSVPPGYYVQGAIREQITRSTQLLFSALHDTTFSTGTSLAEETDFRAGASIKLTRFTTVTATPFFTFGDEETGITPGSFMQYGFEVSIGWRPRKRVTATLTYDFIRHQTELSTDTYTQNSISLRIGYAF
jgi:hypothetical protein